MEVKQETSYVLHHAQKVLAIFAAMRDFAEHLRVQGHRVRYIAIDHPSNRQAIAANLDALIAHHQADRVAYQARTNGASTKSWRNGLRPNGRKA